MPHLAIQLPVPAVVLTIFSLNFHCLQHLFSMSRRFYASKDVDQFPGFVKDKSGSVDTHDILAIHLFRLHDVKIVMGGLIRVTKKYKIQILLFNKLKVRFDRVPADPDNLGIQSFKSFFQCPKLERFLRSA